VGFVPPALSAAAIPITVLYALQGTSHLHLAQVHAKYALILLMPPSMDHLHAARAIMDTNQIVLLAARRAYHAELERRSQPSQALVPDAQQAQQVLSVRLSRAAIVLEDCSPTQLVKLNAASALRTPFHCTRRLVNNLAAIALQVN